MYNKTRIKVQWNFPGDIVAQKKNAVGVDNEMLALKQPAFCEFADCKSVDKHRRGIFYFLQTICLHAARSQ